MLNSHRFVIEKFVGSLGRGRRKALLAVLALASGLLLLAGCGGSGTVGEKTAQAAEQAPAPTVRVVTLHSRSVVLTSELAGRTTASLVAEVRPQVDGIIRKRLFEEGSQVSAGDVLYEIDPATYQAAYDSAVAALKKAAAALPSAQSRADRYADLIARGAISQQDYDDVMATLEEDKAEVAAAQAAVETARINLGYTKITAPISGRIDKSTYTPGALVTANQETALTTIRRLDPINVDVTQSSTSFLNLRQALADGLLKSVGSKVPVKLKLENGTIYPESGTLEFAEAKVDEGTGTYTLRAEFPNPAHLLLPGMYVRAVIEEAIAEKAFLVPQLAVSRNVKGDATALFVTAENKVEERVIDVGRAMDNCWTVKSGVRDGDRVIVNGGQWVKAGQTVKVEEAEMDEKTGEILPNGSQEQSSASVSDAPAQNPSLRG